MARLPLRVIDGDADDHPLSVPALTRQAIKRLQRTAAPAGKLACSSAADPQRRCYEYKGIAEPYILPYIGIAINV
ncbi:MAG: hypothetical protein FJZ79_09885 [Chlorobi bacterium]|nr:hypothetical protein [Chlorobiota bacterium]